MKDFQRENQKDKKLSSNSNKNNESPSNEGISIAPPTFNPVIQKKDEDGSEEKKKYVQSQKGWTPVNKSDIHKSKQWQKVDGKWQEGEKPKVAPIKLSEKYKDEEKKVGWRARPGSKAEEGTSLVTKHFSNEEFHNNVELTENEGQLSTRVGYNRNKFSREAQVYAMNPEGKMGINFTGQQSLMNGPQRQMIHHSSIFAGGDVMHAGHLGLDNGKVDYLDDDSGHYKPGPEHTYNAYKNLKKKGLLKEKGEVGMVDKTISDKTDPAWFENKMTLPFSSYEQSKGNEKQIRNKAKMLGDLKNQYGVPEDENVVPVPFQTNYVVSSGSPAKSYDDIYNINGQERKDKDPLISPPMTNAEPENTLSSAITPTQSTSNIPGFYGKGPYEQKSSVPSQYSDQLYPQNSKPPYGQYNAQKKYLQPAGPYQTDDISDDYLGTSQSGLSSEENNPVNPSKPYFPQLEDQGQGVSHYISELDDEEKI